MPNNETGSHIINVSLLNRFKTNLEARISTLLANKITCVNDTTYEAFEEEEANN